MSKPVSRHMLASNVHLTRFVYRVLNILSVVLEIFEVKRIEATYHT